MDSSTAVLTLMISHIMYVGVAPQTALLHDIISHDTMPLVLTDVTRAAGHTPILRNLHTAVLMLNLCTCDYVLK